MAPPVKKRKIWICNDVWINILPFFRLPQLGLKIALLSSRYDSLVDTHFDDKAVLTIWRDISIYKDKGPKAKLSINCREVEFPSSDRPLPDKICFKDLRIDYIDHSVVTFLRSNKHLWHNLRLHFSSSKKDKLLPIWRIFAREILPLFATTNVRCLIIIDGDHLDKLRRDISPTILFDLNLNSIHSLRLFPDVIANDRPNPTAGQTLAKWLHISTTNGRPKQLFCGTNRKDGWMDKLKEAFPCANTSVSYTIHFASTPIEPFKLVNEQTNEILTLGKAVILGKEAQDGWVIKRCPIGETATVQQQNDGSPAHPLNNVHFNLNGANFLGPLTAPAEGQSNDGEEEVPTNSGLLNAWDL